MLEKNSNLFTLSFYFFLMILAGALEGQLHMTDVVSRVVLGSFLFFSVTFFLIWDRDSNFNVFRDFPFQVLFFFCLYAGIEGVLHADFLVIMHAVGLIAIFYFIYTNVASFPHQKIDSLCRKLGYVVCLYVLLNVVFLIFFPQRMLGGGELNIHSDHPFIGFLSTPNSNADVLFISAVISLLALVFSKKRMDVFLFVLSVVLLFLLIVLSESRSVILSLLFLVGTLLLYTVFKNYRWISVYLKLAILIIIGLIFIGLLLKFRSIHAHAHIFSDSLMGRQGIWCDSIRYLIKKHQSIFGVGLGRQGNIILASGYPYLQAHNTFIDIFLGTGLIGLVLFLLYTFSIYAYLIKNMLSRFNVRSFLFLVAVLSITLHSLVESYLINQLSPDLYCFILLYALAKYQTN